uniref:Uncharacterized protein n=1 Tax=Anguilla anguilla TaxID=7936 RepID=A0A0E9T9P1_ANGAN
MMTSLLLYLSGGKDNIQSIASAQYLIIKQHVYLRAL